MYSVITTTLPNGTVINIKVDQDIYQKYRSAKFNVNSNRVRIGRDYFHKLIMPEPESPDLVIIYKDRDHFNLCRSNLEYISRSEQNKHTKLNHVDGVSSKYLGVTRITRTKTPKWSVKCRGVYIGEFTDELHAAYAYDLYATGANNLGAKFSTNNVSRPVDWNDAITVPEYVPTVPVTSHPVQDPIVRDSEGRAILTVLRHRRKGDAPETIQAIVDDDLWHSLSKLSWTVTVNNQIKTGKGVRTEFIQGKVIELHDKIVLSSETVSTIKYINGNPLDNRRANLRHDNRLQATTVTTEDATTVPTLPAGISQKDMTYDSILKRWKCSFVDGNGDRKWVGFAPTLEIGAEMRKRAMEECSL